MRFLLVNIVLLVDGQHTFTSVINLSNCKSSFEKLYNVDDINSTSLQLRDVSPMS